MAIFTTAYGDWVDDSAADLYTLMQRSLADLRQAVGCTPGTVDATPGPCLVREHGPLRPEAKFIGRYRGRMLRSTC